MKTFREYSTDEQLQVKMAKLKQKKKDALDKAKADLAKTKTAQAAARAARKVKSAAAAAKRLATAPGRLVKKIADTAANVAIAPKKFSIGLAKGAKDAMAIKVKLGWDKTKDKTGYTAAQKMYESKITWKHGIINDGTMRIGIFDPDKEKAMEAARQLIMFLRSNKRVVIGGDKEGEDGVPNDSIQKYMDDLSKLFFDDQVLDDLEPKGHNSNDKANDIVMKRLKDLGVSIK